jgi:hypothetical protein
MTITRGSISRSVGIAVLAAGSLTLGAASGVDPDLYSGLVWRNIWPFRAGRASAVTGAVSQPGVSYAGLPLGGVWKTTCAGETYPRFPVGLRPVRYLLHDAS